MTFLAPALLALGAAIAVPLVLHLLQRHQGPRMVFPALRYLQRAEREHATRIRLRQILLLALRVAAILLLAAAAARPFVRGLGGDHGPTAVVLILDNSLSTSAIVGDRRVLDELRDAARATLRAAGPDDRFWLIRAGEPWEPALTGEPAALLDAVAATRPSAARSDLAAELRRATSILETVPGEPAREIHLFSDLQATALARLDGLPRPAAEAPAVRVFAPDAAAPANRGVVALGVAGGLAPRAGQPATVAVAVGGTFGDSPRDPSDAGTVDSVTVRLLLDGRVRAAATAAPGTEAILRLPAAAPGLLVGRVEIDADALTGDDARHFAVRVAPPASVAATRALPFLEDALGVLAEAGRIRPSTPGVADVVVAPAAEGAEAVRRGAAVVVFPPASPLELPAANRRLDAAGIPWRFGPPAAGEARLDTTAPGLEGALAGVRLRRAYPLTGGSPADSVLLRRTDGAPWAVAGRGEGLGRYVVLASPPTLEGGSLPTSAAMVPLLDRALTVWAARTDAGEELAPGDLVVVPAADSVVSPDGGAEPFREGATLRLRSTGVYRAFAGDTVVRAWAVNPPAGESDLRRLDPGAVAARIGAPDLRLADADDWDAAIFHSRLGSEASLPLAVLALLVLVAESAVAAAGRRTR